MALTKLQSYADVLEVLDFSSDISSVHPMSCYFLTAEDYKSLKLPEASADNGGKVDLSSNADAPPSYSEIIGGQKENSCS